jgi:Domain of unknown function (DUF1735)
MKYNLLNLLTAVLIFTAFNSCQKNGSLDGAGVNLVRFPYSSPTSVNTNPVVALTGTQSGTIQINRDVANASVLAQSETATLSLDNSIIATYNTANGTSFFAVDPSVYSFDASNPLSGGKITVTFKPGEYVKNILFSIDLTKVPAGSSAFGIKIESSTVSKISTGSNTSLVAFIKNPFAGVYNVTGTRYNYSGTVSWDDNFPVPAGNVGTTDMALYSPRTASPDDGVTFEIPLGNIGAAYAYIITYNPTSKTIKVAYSAALAGYSNFSTKVVSLTPPSAGVKASFHITTHYNNAAAGSGNDRIFDETFTQQ